MERFATRCCRVVLVLCLGRPAFGSTAADASAPVYESDMEAFVKLVDNGCPFLSLKGIAGDWSAAKPELMRRAKTCESDEEFLRIVIDAFRILRDGHVAIVQSKVPLPPPRPQYYPGLSFLPATDGRIVVMHAPAALGNVLATGTVVTKIDGMDARRYLEQRTETAWDQGGFFSSPQRARLFEYRLALRGDRGQKHTISYRDDGEERSLTLECHIGARGWPHTYNLPAGLRRVGRSFFYTKLADDVGYMYLRRVDASVPDGIDEALKTYPSLRGWVVDVRGNAGGGYDRQLIERIQRFPKPVAVLIDAGCISAGETLARDFRALADAHLFGSKSAGSSSSKQAWSFPSGIASIRFPVRSRWRNDRKPIEFNGIDPDVQVEAVPEELRAGKNSAILRAHEYIVRTTERPSPEDPGRASDNTDAADSVVSESDDIDPVVGWYKLPERHRETRHVIPGPGALIPILKIDGTYYSVCRGFEIPFKECSEGLEWALTPSSMVGTTIGFRRPSGPCYIRIVDAQRQTFEESYTSGERQAITRVDKPSGLLDATAPRPRSIDDFLGFYRPIWFPWYRLEIRKDGERYLLVEQEFQGFEPPLVWQTRGEPRELTPLPDRLGFTGFGGKQPHRLVYNEALNRFEFVKTDTGARMPLARVSPSPEADAIPPVPIGIPAWH